MAGGGEKSPGPAGNCIDFEIGSVNAVKQVNPLINRSRKSEFDSSPCDVDSCSPAGQRADVVE